MSAMKKSGHLIRWLVSKYQTNMKQKRIIIILVIAVIFLVLTTIILRLRSNSTKAGVTEEIQALPTGIVVPTDKIKTNELDVISVSPKDGTEKVSTNTKILITFSRPPKENEIDFSMGPDTIYSQKIKDNVLTITPRKPLAEGTLYTYSINFPDDKQKVRLYRFVTEGTSQKVLPDTRSKDLITEAEEQERIDHPDIYITNRTPFENETFAITSDFEPKTPAHYFFSVVSKIGDTESTQRAVDAWLQLQGLSEEQITELDIRYK